MGTVFMGKKQSVVLKYVLPSCMVLLAGLYLFDMQKVSELPRFRRCDDSFKIDDGKPLPTRKGFDTLNISGSRRPTQGGLVKYLGGIQMPVYSFDLQLEDHYFIKGSPERWYGYQQSEAVGVDEKNIQLRHYIRRLIHTGKLHHDANDVQTEKQMTEEVGFHYVGIAQKRHRVPQAEQVDQFLDVLKTIPQPAWIHFHCNVGQSRTTIAMVMYDILKNGKEIPLEDIVRRHKLIGSEDLFDTEVWANGSYTKEMLEIRKDFIKAFYRYVNDPEGYGVSSWKDWTTKNNVYQAMIY
jgi:hypothetical protein